MQDRAALTDQPLADDTTDLLNLQRYGRGLGDFIASAKTPITVGIQGGWGSGKTSLINMLISYLDQPPTHERPGVVSVCINAWEHSLFQDSNRAAVAFSLLTAIVNALVHGIEQSPLVSANNQKINEVKSAIGKLGTVAVRAAAFTADFASGSRLSNAMTFAFSDQQGVGNGNTELNNELSQATEVAALRSKVTALVTSAIADSNNAIDRFVVFVDDLDRVHPETAVEILDVMKNILNIPHCVFVLAIDYDVVVKGLGSKFGTRNETNEREFRQYFDKIIQVPFSMPVSSYGRHFPKFIAESISQFTDIELSSGAKNKLGELATLVTDSSPRSVKRIINTLSLLQLIHQSGKTEDSSELDQDDTEKPEAELITRFAIVGIQISYPEVYLSLADNPDFMCWKPEQEHEDPDAEKWALRLREICECNEWTRDRFDSLQRVMEILSSAMKTLDSGERSNGLTPGLSALEDVLDASSVTAVSETTEPDSNAIRSGYRSDQVTMICRQFIATLQETGRDLFKIVDYVSDTEYARRAGTGRGDRTFAWFADGKPIASGELHFDRHRNRSTFNVTAYIEVSARHGQKTELRRYLKQSVPENSSYEARDTLARQIGTISIDQDTPDEIATRLASDYMAFANEVVEHINGFLK